MTEFENEPYREQIPLVPGAKGLSFRALPIPSFPSLRKVCQYYERKSGGSYPVHSRAGRCLFEFSKEIQEHLAGLEKEHVRKSKRLNHLEKVLAEWEILFGAPYCKASPSPASIITPNSLAHALKAQEAKIQEQQETIWTLQKNAGQGKQDVDAAIAQLTSKMNAEREADISEIKSVAAGQMAKLTINFEAELDRLRAEYVKVVSEMEERIAQLTGQNTKSEGKMHQQTLNTTVTEIDTPDRQTATNPPSQKEANVDEWKSKFESLVHGLQALAAESINDA